MLTDQTVSDEVCQSLLDLDLQVSQGVAHRVALATLAGAMRAICEINQDRLDPMRLRQMVMRYLQEASPECRSIFGPLN